MYQYLFCFTVPGSGTCPGSTILIIIELVEDLYGNSQITLERFKFGTQFPFHYHYRLSKQGPSFRQIRAAGDVCHNRNHNHNHNYYPSHNPNPNHNHNHSHNLNHNQPTWKGTVPTYLCRQAE